MKSLAMEAAPMKLLGIISTTGLLLLLGITAPADAQQEQPEKQEQPAKPPKQEQQAKPEKRQDQAKGQQDQQQQQRQQQDKSAKQEQQQAKGQQEQQRQQQDKSAKQEQQQQAKGQQEQQRQQQGKSAKQEQQQQAKGQQEQQRQQQDKSARQEQQRTQQRDRSQEVSEPSRQKPHGQEGEQRGAWQERRAHSWQSEHRDWQQRGGYIGYRIPDDRFRGHFGRDHEFRVYSLPVLVVGGYPRFQYGGFWFSLIDPWPEYWSDDWYDNDDVYVDYSEDGYYLYNHRHPGDRIAISVYVN
jgi:hypothetical protein